MKAQIIKRVYKQGDSLAMIIPHYFAKTYDLKEGHIYLFVFDDIREVDEPEDEVAE